MINSPRRFAINREFAQLAFPVLALVGFIGFGAILIFARTMGMGYNHDENQFVASAYLLAKQGLLPYLDYPYFHMPNLIIPYALLFLQASNILFWGRLFSVLCAVFTLGLLVFSVFHFYRHRPGFERTAMAAGAGLLLLANPLFVFTSGRVWNHDAAVLLLLLAVLAFLIGFRRIHITRWMFLVGLLLSLAVGVRLSILTVLPAFVLTLLIHPETNRFDSRRWLRLGTGMFLGFFVGLLPSLALFVADPQAFIFGNVGYAQLNTAYRQDTAFAHGMDLQGKFVFFQKYVLNEPANLLLFLLVIYLVYFGGAVLMRQRRKLDPKVFFMMLLVVFTGLGAFLPTPTFYQYFYIPALMSILVVSWSLAQITRTEDTPVRLAWLRMLFLLVVLLTSLYGLGDTKLLRTVNQIRRWYPTKAHTIGNEIRKNVESGKILTLAPLFALEAGLDIYPEFATGPFAFRTAYLLTPAERIRFHMFGPDDLESLLEADPPAGILTGKNPDLDVSLVDYAQDQDYQPIQLDDDLFLWVKNSP
jgi:hypothetical protein